MLEPEPVRLRCLTHSFAWSTGPNGVIADLVHLPDGDTARGAGQAALVDGLATPVTILRASRAALRRRFATRREVGETLSAIAR